jgi:DNA repair photolyase
MARYRWISCSSLVNRIVGEDRLFFGNYTIDPYQKCDLGCIYCDAADEIIYIKSNAPEILQKEIEIIGDGMVIIGSTADPYQLIEKKQELTKRILGLLVDNQIRFHILTKSDLVLRDLPLFDKSSVTISISTLAYSKVLEPNAPDPKRRFEVVKELVDNGINAGIAIMPILPFLTEVEDITRLSKDAGARYLIYEYLEMKGDCREKILNFLKDFAPQHIESYRELYKNGYKVSEVIEKYCKEYDMQVGFRDEREC